MSGHANLLFALHLAVFCVFATGQKLAFRNHSTLFVPPNTTHDLVLVCELTDAKKINFQSQFFHWYYNRGLKDQISLSRNPNVPSDQGLKKFKGLRVTVGDENNENPSLSTYSLTIPPPILFDYSGVFECFITSKEQPDEPALSDRITLLVVEPPSKVVVMPGNTKEPRGPISLPPEGQADLTCLVIGRGTVPMENIKIEMKLGISTVTGKVESVTNDETVPAGGYAFKFTRNRYRIRAADSGKKLTCTASIVEEGAVVLVPLADKIMRMATSSSRVISLPVKPNIDCGKDTRYSKIGTRNLNITCTVSGSGPFSESHWTMPNNAVVDSNTNSRQFEYRVSNRASDRPSFSLFIHTVSKDTFGTYTFKVRNRIGFSTKEVRVRDVGQTQSIGSTAANRGFPLTVLLTPLCACVVLRFYRP